jgi:hypothetical protein
MQLQMHNTILKLYCILSNWPAETPCSLWERQQSTMQIPHWCLFIHTGMWALRFLTPGFYFTLSNVQKLNCQGNLTMD